ncbi:MAG: protein TolR [Alphaproteobacteria bacterium]|nr:protein TolR [Alphaproteobacteria bacterium]
MGAQIKQPGRRGGSRRGSVMSDINITPFVDVMLVLLIVFMVTAPMMTVGISVDLPETEASSINEKTEPLTISVNKEGRIFLQETEVDLASLVPRLQAITGENQEARIFIRGDQTINYGAVVTVMGSINAAGYKKVALLAELPKTDKPKEKK